MPTKNQTERKIHALALSIGYNAILVDVNIEVDEVTWQEARAAQRVRLSSPDPQEIVSEKHQTPMVLAPEEAEAIVEDAEQVESAGKETGHRRFGRW